jgi:hypothetical protein
MIRCMTVYRAGKRYLRENGVEIEVPVNPVPPPVAHRVRPPSPRTTLTVARYEVCKMCAKSGENGHKCALHKGCCFGRWRANPANQCPLGKWLDVTLENSAKSES